MLNTLGNMLLCQYLVTSISWNSHVLFSRRKLVLDRLLVVLPDILTTVELSLDQTLEDIKSLIETLNLEKDTIIFRPGQWAVVAGELGFVILKSFFRFYKLVNYLYVL